MEADLFIILCKFIVLFIYGTICILSIIFTFAINTYIRLSEFLDLEFLSRKTTNPLERNIDFIEDWLISYNKIIGPLLILLSLWDIVMFFKVLNSF